MICENIKSRHPTVHCPGVKALKKKKRKIISWLGGGGHQATIRAVLHTYVYMCKCSTVSIHAMADCDMKTSENHAILCCQNMLCFIPGNPCQMSDQHHPPIPRRNPRQPMRSNTMSSFDQKKPTPAPRHKAGEKYFLIRAHFHSLSLASVTCLASFPGHSLDLGVAWERG